MSRYTAEEALEMICDQFDSGGELDIEEDFRFPLPHPSDDDDEGDLSLSPPLSPSPSLITTTVAITVAITVRSVTIRKPSSHQ